jgi:hypothetical protein
MKNLVHILLVKELFVIKLPLTSVYANIGSAFKATTLNDMYAGVEILI